MPKLHALHTPPRLIHQRPLHPPLLPSPTRTTCTRFIPTPIPIRVLAGRSAHGDRMTTDLLPDADGAVVGGGG